MLIEGRWTQDTPDRTDRQGRFVRRDSAFRNWISADGHTGFPAASGRYHLYVSLACPWAHRTLLMHRLKGLEATISLSVVEYLMGDDGWSFGAPGSPLADPLHGARLLRDVYLKARHDYTGRVTVPVLWDKQSGTVVNNESRDILRMLDTEFDAFASNKVTFLPPGSKNLVDAEITENYESINNGVYRCGFARSQAAYEQALERLFAGLERCEATLARQRYLCGGAITEADWCLFTTLVRFDSVYYSHFKCNLRRIADTPNLWNYLRDLYQVPGVGETVDFKHIKGHYFGSHKFLNPSGIIPRGPLLDFLAPHDRGRFSHG
jgi:putative glutathione S-transferase